LAGTVIRNDANNNILAKPYFIKFFSRFIFDTTSINYTILIKLADR